jgi:hypothetical protein
MTFSRLNAQLVSRWQLFLKERSPSMHCVKGEHDTLADVLSHRVKIHVNSFSRQPRLDSFHRRRKLLMISKPRLTNSREKRTSCH